MSAAAAGAVLGTIGNFMGGYLQGKAGRKEAARAVKLMRMQADRVLRDGKRDARRMRINSLSAVGSMYGAVAKGGITMTGSAMDMISQNEGRLEQMAVDVEEAAAFDARMIRMGADVRRKSAKDAGRLGMAGAAVKSVSTLGGLFGSSGGGGGGGGGGKGGD